MNASSFGLIEPARRLKELVHPTKRSLRASHSHRMAAAPDQLLLKTPNSKAATDWSSDGRFILYESQEPQTGSDLWAVDLKEPRKQFPLVQTEFEEVNGQFSPDGKWIGYESNESGRFEIYVQPFSRPGRKTQVSLKGGAQVRWRRDGKALLYIALDDRLTEVPLRFSASGQVVSQDPRFHSSRRI